MTNTESTAVFCNITWSGTDSPLDRARAGDFYVPVEMLGRYRRADPTSPWWRNVQVEFDIDGKTASKVADMIAALPSLDEGKFDISFNDDGNDDVYYEGWRLATEEEIRFLYRWLRREDYLAAEREKDRIAMFKADHPELFPYEGAE